MHWGWRRLDTSCRPWVTCVRLVSTHVVLCKQFGAAQCVALPSPMRQQVRMAEDGRETASTHNDGTVGEAATVEVAGGASRAESVMHDDMSLESGPQVGGAT